MAGRAGEIWASTPAWNSKRRRERAFPKKELDLVALRGRNLVLAECKESTEHFAKPEEASKFARELADTIVLADHLGASHLLVASSTTIPVEEEVLLKDAPADHSVDLLWLDDRHLLDPHFFASPLTFPSVSKPEGWDEEYLESLRTGLVDAGG